MREMGSSTTDSLPMEKTSDSPQPQTVAPRDWRAVWLAVLPPLLGFALLIGVWALVSVTTKGSIPSPYETSLQAIEVFSHPFYRNGPNDQGVGWNILMSLERVAMGFGLAAVVGIAAGLAIGLNRFLRRGFDPLIQVLRTVPPLAWLPISLLLFQQADTAAIFVIFITAIWPIIINTAVGINEIPQDYTNVARVLRLRKRSYLRDILMPATAPYVFTGLRIAIGLAWLAIVAAEMLKADGGIGFFIWDAYNAGGDSSTSQIILAIVVIGLVGLALDRLVAAVGTVVAKGGQ